MIITIKHVGIEERPAKGKGQPYSMAEIIYDDGRGTKTYKMASFANPQVFATIKAAKSGEQYDVTVVKGDDGYNKWTSATPAGGASTNAPQAGGSASPRPQTNNFAGRDFESKEERTTKQRLIVRQSSLKEASGIAISGNTTVFGGKKPNLDEILELADKLTAWVYEAPGLSEDKSSLAEMEDDIPY